MAKGVILLHEEPDGSRHFDWLIARDEGQAEPDPDRRDLLTLRIDLSQGIPVGQAFEARRLPDHRHLYLTFQGPIAGGRGSVQRVAEGRATLLAEAADRVDVRWEPEGGGGRWWRYVGRAAEGQTGGDRWRFEVIAAG